MIKLDLNELDKIRKEGYRPGVVVCLIYDRKLLMFYKKEHKIWQLPQGGIKNMEFKPGRHEVEQLFDDSGNKVEMLGKYYYFCAIQTDSPDLDISKSKFDQYFWVTFAEGYFLADHMYQQGKKRITHKILNRLQELDLIS